MGRVTILGGVPMLCNATAGKEPSTVCPDVESSPRCVIIHFKKIAMHMA